MSNRASFPKRNRCWLRFSLRSFLVLLTAACVLLGWFVHRANQQRRAVAWVKEHGGFVRYDFQFNENGDFSIDAEPPGPDWLRAWVGLDYFADVTKVSLFGTSVNDIAPLASLRGLEELDLHGTRVSDLKPLEKLEGLRTLYLTGSRVSNLGPLARLVHLELLHFDSTPITNIAPLANLTSLRWLQFSDTQVSDLSPLSKLRNLEVLFVPDTQVSDVAPLENLKSLTELYLSETCVRDVSPLQNLNQLEVLTLYESRISTVGYVSLRKSLPNCHILPGFRIIENSQAYPHASD